MPDPMRAAQGGCAVEPQRPLNAVLEQTAQLLQEAMEKAAAINLRLIPSNVPMGHDLKQPQCPPPSGVVGQANDLRNRAQRLLDELQQISERL